MAGHATSGAATRTTIGALTVTSVRVARWRWGLGAAFLLHAGNDGTNTQATRVASKRMCVCKAGSVPGSVAWWRRHRAKLREAVALEHRRVITGFGPEAAALWLPEPWTKLASKHLPCMPGTIRIPFTEA
jgi:hypothetical protein